MSNEIYNVSIISKEHLHFNDKLLKFDDLPPALKDMLASEGKSVPTPIQAHSFYPVIERHDILAQSMTGSGKTLAFSLPLACRLMQSQSKKKQGPTVLILVPTRELAYQVSKVFHSTLKSCKPKIATLIGGAAYFKQEQELRADPEIIIGTPGRIVDFIKKGTLHIKDLESFVLDEVDQMLDTGFAEELSFIRNKLPESIQTLFFSATLDRKSRSLANEFLNNPVHIHMEKATEAPNLITHGYITVREEVKQKALASILIYHNPSQALIFCETKSECSEVAQALVARGLNATQINGDLSQNDRSKAMANFKSGTLQYLVATNVAARGIDVQHLPLVINYTPPKDNDSYTHRVGRTGRARTKGTAWTLVSPGNFRQFKGLMSRLGTKPEKVELPNEKAFIEKIISREFEKPQTTESSTLVEHVQDIIKSFSPDEIRAFLGQFLTRRLMTFGVCDPSQFQWSEGEMSHRLTSQRSGSRSSSSSSYGGGRRERSWGGARSSSSQGQGQRRERSGFKRR